MFPLTRPTSRFTALAGGEGEGAATPVPRNAEREEEAVVIRWNVLRLAPCLPTKRLRLAPPARRAVQVQVRVPVAQVEHQVLVVIAVRRAVVEEVPQPAPLWGDLQEAQDLVAI